jgi:ribose 5-phosphate isomerase B
MGSRVVGSGLALDILRTWLAAEFATAARHQRRVEKMMALDGDRTPEPATNTGC